MSGRGGGGEVEEEEEVVGSERRGESRECEGVLIGSMRGEQDTIQ